VLDGFFTGRWATDGNTVYVTTAQSDTTTHTNIQTLHAYADGKIWQVGLDSTNYPAAGVLANGVVYTSIEGGGGWPTPPFVIATDATTGDLLWKSDPFINGMAAPLVVDGHLVVQHSEISVYGVN
jgi:outer membrane protein assembly factor BamB